jgi:hypothetical protein
MSKKSKGLKIRPQSASDLVIKEEFLHPSYSLDMAPDAEATKTGLLRLFSLRPRDPSMPTFHGRWDPKDGMSPRIGSSAIDLDAEGLSDQEEKAFISGEKGFSGHHSAKLDEGKHKISITTPQLGKIFDGVLEMKASATASILDLVNVISGESIRIFNPETGETLYAYRSPTMGDK